MKILTKHQLVFLHDRIIEETGGRPGVRDGGSIEAALARPFATFDGQELFPSIAEKAATLTHALVKGHPFVDGNKRTAMTAAAVVLVLNGYRLLATQEDFEETAVAVAIDRLDVQALAEWFRKNMITVVDDHKRPLT